MKHLLAILIILTLAIPSVFAYSYYIPHFGVPIVTESSIVFDAPGMVTHRIISLDRNSGEKNWELFDPNNYISVLLGPCDSFDNRFVIIKGTDFFFCDPSNGSTVLAYRTNLEYPSIKAYRGPLVFVNGLRGHVKYLQLVNLKEGIKIWEVPEVGYTPSTGNGLALCLRAKRKVSIMDRSYQLVNPRLTAISIENGSIKWEYELPDNIVLSRSFHVGEYFVVENDDVIYCFEQDTGKLIETVKLRGDNDGSVSLSKRNGKIFARIQHGNTYLDGVTVYELSVPTLERRVVTGIDREAAISHIEIEEDIIITQPLWQTEARNLKTNKVIWKLATWYWSGVHDGYIYYRARDRDDKDNLILGKIHVATGERKVLYREVPPKELQKRKKFSGGNQRKKKWSYLQRREL